MTLGERISKAKERVAVATYAKEEYRKQITESVSRMLVCVDGLTEDSKELLNMYAPKFLDTIYVSSIREMDYEQLESVREELSSIIESLLDEIEKVIK